MEKEMLPQPDKNGIIKSLPDKLSEQNIQRINKFGAFMFLYDFAQDHFVRPRLHKADPYPRGLCVVLLGGQKLSLLRKAAGLLGPIVRAIQHGSNFPSSMRVRLCLFQWADPWNKIGIV